MVEIRPIESKADQDAYRALAKYCFVDTGWVDRAIPQPADIAAEIGVFEDGRLTTALITNALVCNLFGEEHGMSGIGAVASWPQDRGKGHVRALMRHALLKDREEGRTVSSLYPFKFSFYAKLGYGSIGGFAVFRFSPLDIRKLPPLKGAWTPFDGTERAFGDYRTVASAWASRYDFACLPARLSAERLCDSLAFSKESCYLYASGGKPKAMIRYGMTPIGPHAKRMDVRKAAWTDAEGVQAVFHFLALHRDQVPEIEWRGKRDISVHLLTVEPRVQCSLTWDWMARPVDLPRLLADRAKADGFGGRAEFSVVDDLVESNSGAYRVEGGSVSHAAKPAENPIDMPLLSSLLFGGLTYEEAAFAGLQLPEGVRALFAHPRPIWLSEMF